MKKKLLVAIVVSGLGLAFLALSGFAQADGEVSFGIRPTKADPDRPETFSYFIHELVPGAVLTDEALLINSGAVPLTLKLYAADGITAINGGTAFAHQDVEAAGASRGVSRWLSLSVTETPLQPGEDRVVPFTIDVPSDTLPGQYVAGLVVEALSSGLASSSTGGDEAQFAVTVIRRVGVAVVIDIPGPHVAGLEISDASLRQQDDQGATFVIGVHNTGNIFMKAVGSLLITDRNGVELAAIPLRLDTILPGDATTFHISHPYRLADGEYLLTVVLNYEGESAILEGVEVTVKDGQPEGEEEESILPRALTELFPAAAEEPALAIWLYALGAAALLVLAAVPLVIVLRRRRRQA